MLTQSRLKELLNYDSETGIFVWIIPRGGKAKKGTVAGKKHNRGYMQIRIDTKLYLSHRLAWLYVYGEFPCGELDHIDMDASNNKIKNLRESTRSQNNFNKAGNNRDLPRGVHRHQKTKKYRSRIQFNGKGIHLGFFENIKDAENAYIKKAKELFGEFYPINQSEVLA